MCYGSCMYEDRHIGTCSFGNKPKPSDATCIMDVLDEDMLINDEDDSTLDNILKMADMNKVSEGWS